MDHMQAHELRQKTDHAEAAQFEISSRIFAQARAAQLDTTSDGSSLVHAYHHTLSRGKKGIGKLILAAAS